MRFPLVPVATGAALLTLLAAPPALALGEVSTTASYTCTTGSGDLHPAVRYSVGAPPVTVVAGQTVRLPTTATLALDAATTGLVGAEPGAASVTGTVTSTPTASRLGLDLALSPTALGNGANGVTNVPLTGDVVLRATAAGPDALRLGDLGDLALTGLDAGGTSAGSLVFPTVGSLGSCTDDLGGHALLATGGVPVTVEVTRDTTSTAVGAAFAPSRALVTGTARVHSHFGLRAAGTVAFTLRRGTHVIATVRSAVDRHGVARARFTGVSRPGGYAVVGRYLGDAGLQGSHGTDAFRIGG
jgi:hypothetical protein